MLPIDAVSVRTDSSRDGAGAWVRLSSATRVIVGEGENRFRHQIGWARDSAHCFERFGFQPPDDDAAAFVGGVVGHRGVTRGSLITNPGQSSCFFDQGNLPGKGVVVRLLRTSLRFCFALLSPLSSTSSRSSRL